MGMGYRWIWSSRRLRTRGTLGPSPEDDKPLFSIQSVHAAIVDLSISLDKSEHWIVNKLIIQPLASGMTGEEAFGAGCGGAD
jgi:hypothetical protein